MKMNKNKDIYIFKKYNKNYKNQLQKISLNFKKISNKKSN